MQIPRPHYRPPPSDWRWPRNLHFNPTWFIFSLKLEGPGLGFWRTQLPLLSKLMGTRSLKTQGKGLAAHGLAMGRRHHWDQATSEGASHVTRCKGLNRSEAGGSWTQGSWEQVDKTA